MPIGGVKPIGIHGGLPILGHDPAGKGPVIDVPGRGNREGGGTIKPKLPITMPGNVVVDNVNVPVATAIVQVFNQDNQWATKRTIVVPRVTKFRWSTTSNQAVSARWELFQQIAMPKPGGQPGPTAVLLGHGDLMIPPLGTKQEFTIDMAKHLNFAAPSYGYETKLRIVVYDAAKKQIQPGSNQVTMDYLPLNVKVGNYQRFSGNFQANEPAVDAFIRATIANQSSTPIEQGARFEFYAKLGNGAPTKIGEGMVPAIGAYGLTTVIATRPVADWDKSDAQSQYTYECKVFVVK